MSIGERITQIRKENGLSQEQFGSAINVTRQTVSKWEMNQSIPDVDKCIEISKQYNVSIEWLLGIKETRIDENKQINTIESIIKKNSKEKKLHILFVGFLFILCIFIGFFMYSSISSLKMNQNTLQNNIEELTNKLNEQNDNLNKLEELLFNQQEITINELTLNNYDYINNTANLHIDITPKEIQDNMIIKIYVNNGLETIYANTNEKNKKYVADIKITLTDLILVSATIKTNGIEKTVNIKKIENALKDTYYQSIDYSNYGFKLAHENSKKIISLDISSKYKPIQDLEINTIKSYIFINSIFYGIVDSNITYIENINKYINEIEIDVSNINERNLDIEIIDVLTDSSNRIYISGGFKYSINTSNVNNHQYKPYENYIVDKNFEWERYE